jgi:hypothetical protein
MRRIAVKNVKIGISLLVIGICVYTAAVQAQESISSVSTAPASTVSALAEGAQVPRLVRFSGTLLDERGNPRSGIAGITLLLYREQTGGAPLWIETQNVTLDAKGHYIVLLGAGKSEGLPMDLFASGEARWLGVQAEGQPEQPRALLLSVPYALKAADAETLGGRPASEYVRSTLEDASPTTATASSGAASVSSSSQSAVSTASITGSGTKNFIPIWTSSSALGNSTIAEISGKVGIGTGTTTPVSALQVVAPNQLGLFVQGPVTGVGSGIDLQTTGTGGTQWEILATGKTSAQGVGKFNIRDVSTGQDRLTIATSGVGIGKTSPGFPLDVNGNANVSGTLFANTAQLIGNLVSGPINVFNGSVQDGIFVKSQGTNSIGVNADTPNGAVAMLGTNENDTKFANAIQGQANGFTQETIGVWGISQSPAGMGTLGTQGESGIFKAFEGVVGAGVWGDTNGAGGNHVGVVGTSDAGIGVGAHTNGNAAAALYVQNDTTDTSALLFDAIGGSVFGECFINVSGDLHCTGSITPVVAVKQGTRKAALYAMASPENWFEDFGTGQLSNGTATIALDPEFAETVTTTGEYHVFLTANGECKGLYVAQKSPTSFEVRELGGGASGVAFDYRIVAHRKGQETTRMADLTDRLPKHEAGLAALDARRP